jgi:hypothetical protein
MVLVPRAWCWSLVHGVGPSCMVLVLLYGKRVSLFWDILDISDLVILFLYVIHRGIYRVERSA